MHTNIYDEKLIVITGALGFIGSAVVRHLNDKGYQNLILVDDFKGGEKWKNICGKRYQELLSKHDLFDWLEHRESEVEAIIHLGASSSTTMTDGDYLQKNNYQYSIRLAEHALQNEIRFIYASSAATYGLGHHQFSDEHALLEELRPLNLYGYTKHMVDLWMKDQGVLDQVVGLKYFNVYGPNENHKNKMASMVYHMTKGILEEGVVRLFKSTDSKYHDGDQVRDFIYVKEAVDITCCFLENDLAGIFNVGSGEPHSWNDLANAVFKALGKREHIEYFDMPSELKSHYLNYTCADRTKFFRALEKKDLEKPKSYSFEESIYEYINDYLLENKRW